MMEAVASVCEEELRGPYVRIVAFREVTATAAVVPGPEAALPLVAHERRCEVVQPLQCQQAQPTRAPSLTSGLQPDVEAAEEFLYRFIVTIDEEVRRARRWVRCESGKGRTKKAMPRIWTAIYTERFQSSYSWSIIRSWSNLGYLVCRGVFSTPCHAR